MTNPDPQHQSRDDNAERKGIEIETGSVRGLHAVPPEPAPPSPEQFDEDEAELRALRIDLPGAGGAAPTGIISIGVTDKLPKSVFIRARADTIVVNMLPFQTGMEKEFYAIRPEMIPELASIGIDVVAYRLFLIVTTEGAAKIVPSRQADVDGSLNEWSRTKEVVLTRAQKVWVRPVSDKANGRFRCFDAPSGRYPDPVFPELGWAALVKLGFKDRGYLLHSNQHPLFLKLAGRADAE